MLFTQPAPVDQQEADKIACYRKGSPGGVLNKSFGKLRTNARG